MSFQISVILPVYNAQQFVEKAILSALDQKEVAEVIVINDGSTDKTSKILAKLEKEHLKLRTFQHPNKENRGRAASKNLGINVAKNNFVAFLDADDYYLEDRFKMDKEIFEINPELDGVYNAIGAHFYRKASEEERARLELTTIKYPIAPENLFNQMSPKGDAGYFSGDGLTVKRDIFEKVGNFNEDLEVAEDTHMWLKMALKAKLAPGVLDKPLSIRGVHEDNVFNLYGTLFYQRNIAKMYFSLLPWSYKKGLKLEVLEYFYKMTLYNYNYLEIKNDTGFKKFGILAWLTYAVKFPKLLTSRYFIYSNPLVKFYKKKLKSKP